MGSDHASSAGHRQRSAEDIGAVQVQGGVVGQGGLGWRGECRGEGGGRWWWARAGGRWRGRGEGGL